LVQKVVEALKLSWDEKLERFKKFLDILRGKVEIRSRLAPLLEPSKIQTSTRLSANEVEFVTDSYFFAKCWPEFQPLKDFANEFCYTKISHEGLGRLEAIQFVGAVEQTKLFKALFEAPPKKKKPGRFRKEEEKPEA